MYIRYFLGKNDAGVQLCWIIGGRWMKMVGRNPSYSKQKSWIWGQWNKCKKCTFLQKSHLGPPVRHKETWEDQGILSHYISTRTALGLFPDNRYIARKISDNKLLIHSKLFCAQNALDKFCAHTAYCHGLHYWGYGAPEPKDRGQQQPQ